MDYSGGMRCSVYIAVSADGFIARKDGGIDWLHAVAQEGEDYGYQAFFDSVDGLVLGRKTYEVAASFEAWPYAGKRCVVLSHRGGEPRHGEEFWSGSPAVLVEKLRGEGLRHLYVDGGDVIRQFLSQGLIQELTLSVIPILLGDGLPLFGPGGREQRLELISCRSWPTGLAQLKYRVG